MSTRILTLTTAVVIAAIAAAPARAQGGVEFGGFGSYTQFDTSLALKERAGAGARLSLISGYGWSTFILEAEGGYSEQKIGLSTVKYIPARARLLYAVPLGSTASILLGGGGVRNDYYDETTQTHASDWGYTALAGLRVKLGSFMSLRLDAVVDYIENPVNESDAFPNNINKAVHAGLQFPLWQSKFVPPAKEKGKWNVTETQAPPKEEPKEEPKPEPKKEEEPAKDEPAQPTPIVIQQQMPANEGPDADRDGVPDARDICAATAPGSTVDPQGCQVYRDTDDDGVTDVRDRCPATPHGTMIDGYGCPARPMEVVRERESRDTDADGVEDAKDKCPATPAGTPADASGCPIVIPKMEGPRTVTLRGVTFMSGRDELTPSSLVVLDEVAKQLVAVPDLKIEIAGHTDSRGTRIRNIRLSLSRAEAVRAYLVMQGVPAERLTARGYGPDKPVASNANPNGRAMNRRVELKRLD
jgi:outer membrane protein OmpA-like peptidoglycan-associated protein